MIKNCLTCKYEPEWGHWTKGEYPRTSGACKWDGELSKKLKESLPSTYTVTIKRVIRHSDDSGVMNRCPLWKEKSDGNS